MRVVVVILVIQMIQRTAINLLREANQSISLRDSLAKETLRK
jgi:hypothetical protein